MKRFIFLLFAVLILGCSSKKELISSSSTLDNLSDWMTGSFSSAKQSEQDSSFYNINLDMRRIWPQHIEAIYVYVEQAVSNKLNSPYRQRIYKITEESSGHFASEVFEIPNDDRFILKGKTPKSFDILTPDSLVVREGCTVYLSQISSNEFSGSTKNDECKSTLYGASYATSKVQVFKDKIISWDQGWDENDEQVWGAEKSGYIFLRKNE